MKTIIYTHPYPHSFNHAILARLEDYFDQTHQAYQVIDLYRDGFDPRLTAADLRVYDAGETTDPLVRRYQQMIAEADELVLIFPIWWHNLPAELKGFFDKVMLNHFAANFDPTWQGLLTYIKKVTVITTATDTKAYEIQCGDPIRGSLINAVLADLGIEPANCRWLHMGRVDKVSAATRAQFLADLPKLYRDGQA